MTRTARRRLDQAKRRRETRRQAGNATVLMRQLAERTALALYLAQPQGTA